MDMAKKKPNENKPTVEIGEEMSEFEDLSEEKVAEPTPLTEDNPYLESGPSENGTATQPPLNVNVLTEILRLSEERTSKLEEKIMNLTNTLNQIAAGMTGKGMGNRPSSVIHYEDSRDEETPQKKGMNPMDIFKMITDIMNNPMVQKIADKFIGGGEEVKATQEYMPSQEEVKLAREMMAYKDGQMKKMDGWQERFMEATVKNLELINLKANKELESDLSSS